MWYAHCIEPNRLRSILCYSLTFIYGESNSSKSCEQEIKYSAWYSHCINVSFVGLGVCKKKTKKQKTKMEVALYCIKLTKNNIVSNSNMETDVLVM